MALIISHCPVGLYPLPPELCRPPVPRQHRQCGHRKQRQAPSPVHLEAGHERKMDVLVSGGMRKGATCAKETQRHQSQPLYPLHDTGI